MRMALATFATVALALVASASTASAIGTCPPRSNPHAYVANPAACDAGVRTSNSVRTSTSVPTSRSVPTSAPVRVASSHKNLGGLVHMAQALARPAMQQRRRPQMQQYRRPVAYPSRPAVYRQQQVYYPRPVRHHRRPYTTAMILGGAGYLAGRQRYGNPYPPRGYMPGGNYGGGGYGVGARTGPVCTDGEGEGYGNAGVQQQQYGSEQASGYNRSLESHQRVHVEQTRQVTEPPTHVACCENKLPAGWSFVR